MEQTFKDLTPNLELENESNELDIEGTVLKVELKPSLTQIQKPNARNANANQSEFLDEMKYENQANDQNALLIEEMIDGKLENKEIRSYICGKNVHSEENSSILKESSTKKAKARLQNICEICKKSFTTKSYLKLHVQTVHDEVKEHKCETCSHTFGQKGGLQFHVNKYCEVSTI